MGLPGICALHGSLVGGGVAYSLNNPVRFADNKASACFGNLSRGAVPGMVLSSNIPQALGLQGALDIYLTDNTYSSYACVKAGYLHGIQGSIQATKQEALKQARRLGQSPAGMRIVGIKPELDVERFGLEAWCIDLGARTEGVFRNVGAKGPKEVEAEKKAAEATKNAGDDKPKVEECVLGLASHVELDPTKQLYLLKRAKRVSEPAIVVNRLERMEKEAAVAHLRGPTRRPSFESPDWQPSFLPELQLVCFSGQDSKENQRVRRQAQAPHFKYDFEERPDGSFIWHASLVLLHYLQAPERARQFRGRRVLELGSGLGHLGHGLARLGAEVTCTDQVKIMPVLQESLRQLDREHGSPSSFGGSIRTVTLDWGEEGFAASEFAKED
ncbi:unnamed protein product [Effrenium voratum]|nr:unnamed protein product [Effrenium voratum]